MVDSAVVWWFHSDWWPLYAVQVLLLLLLLHVFPSRTELPGLFSVACTDHEDEPHHQEDFSPIAPKEPKKKEGNKSQKFKTEINNHQRKTD